MTDVFQKVVGNVTKTKHFIYWTKGEVKHTETFDMYVKVETNKSCTKHSKRLSIPISMHYFCLLTVLTPHE